MPSKRSAHDKHLATVVGIVLAILAAGFAGVWFYLKHMEQLSAEVSYLRMPPIAISRSGHSISATVAIKVSGADAKWASENKRALDQIMQRVLLETDPQRALAPNGLLTLQDTMRAASNVALHTDKVQEILITDFLVSEGDL